jgi:hypothetical protein
MFLLTRIIDSISRHADFLLYLLKCVIGTIIGYYIYRVHPEAGGLEFGIDCTGAVAQPQ